MATDVKLPLLRLDERGDGEEEEEEVEEFAGAQFAVWDVTMVPMTLGSLRMPLRMLLHGLSFESILFLLALDCR